MYQALYRKWRPLSFADVIGQQHITDTLRTQLKNERLSHAYLFTGTRGTGKTTCAKILARAVNCENPQNGDPCNVCPACKGILEGSVLDVTEIDAASNNGVDNIRDLIEETRYTPSQVKRRVFIIDEVHMLSTGAFNALLKTLEEPPSHVLFILATTEIHKVPVTILSRCQRFDFRRIDSDAIAKRLVDIAASEQIQLDEDAAKLIARLADGAMRDALSMLDRAAAGGAVDTARVSETLGVLTQDHVLRLAEFIRDSDLANAIACVGEAYQDGRELTVVFEQLLTLLRDALLVKTAKQDVSDMISPSYSVPQLQALCESMAASKLVTFAGIISECIGRMKQSANRRVEAELCAVRLCQLAAEDYDTVAGRVDALEEKLSRGAFTVASAAPSPKTATAPEPQAAQAEGASSLPAQKKSPARSQVQMWSQWIALLNKLTAQIPMSRLSILKTSAKGVLDDGTLIIYCDNSIAVDQIKDDATKQVIQRIAATLDASITRVKVREGDGSNVQPSQNTDLAELEKTAKQNDIPIIEE